jgi:hypothetical protein
MLGILINKTAGPKGDKSYEEGMKLYMWNLICTIHTVHLRLNQMVNKYIQNLVRRPLGRLKWDVIEMDFKKR